MLLNDAFAVRADRDAAIVSFPRPVRTLSWAVLNGGFCHADHVIIHHVNGDDRLFCAQPETWLEQAAARLGLRGTVVAMATAVEMKNLIRSAMHADGVEVTCFATVGCSNALSVGDPATVMIAGERAPAPLHTINLIVTVQPGLTDQAMVEAVQIATEGRVRALQEAGIQSSVSNLVATGTGTDCIAVASFGGNPARYCGKHTQFGELIGNAAYHAVKRALSRERTTSDAASTVVHSEIENPWTGKRS
jgi:iron complex transport system ATP-binding protein